MSSGKSEPEVAPGTYLSWPIQVRSGEASDCRVLRESKGHGARNGARVKGAKEPPDSVRSLDLLLEREAETPSPIHTGPSSPLTRMNWGMHFGKCSLER